MSKPFTRKQGEYLAYIADYIALHGRSPAEADIVAFFKVSPPTVHQMIASLEKRGLIARQPGKARSIRLLIEPELLPALPGTASAPSMPSLAAASVATGLRVISRLLESPSARAMDAERLAALVARAADAIGELVLSMVEDEGAAKGVRERVLERAVEHYQRLAPSTFSANGDAFRRLLAAQ